MAARSYSDDYYHRVHISPLTLDAGIVAADRVFSGYVWNAHFTPQDLASIALTDGITVSGITAPSTMAALLEMPITISISAEIGPDIIDHGLAFIFPDETPTISITGSRGVPWPFQPRSELIESCEWLTDIVPSYDGEDRVSLRDTPLREFQLTHVAQPDLQQEARRLARSLRAVLAPDWPRQVIADAYTGAPAALPDGPVIIWRSPTDYTQTTVTAGTLGPLPGTDYGVRILPLMICRVVDGWSNTRPAGPWAEMAITLQTATDYDTPADTLYPMFADLPMVTDCVVIGSGSADEGVTWESDTTDNGIALPADVRASGYAAERYTARWYVTRTDYPALRAWIYARRGQFAPFWLPSWSADLRNVARSGVSITADNYDTHEGHIVAEIAGTLYPRVVVSAAQSGGRWTVTPDTPLPDGTITRVMYLRRVRFAADRIEFRHAAGQGVAVAVQCVQVPE
jgi:hypothetical protein